MTTSLEALVQRCESEQLYLSGAIQPFGALIRIDTASGLITHVSANIDDILGVEAPALLGQPRKRLSWLSAQVLESLPEQPGKSVVIPDVGDRSGRKVNGLAIRGTGCILMELEKVDAGFETVSVQQLQTPLLRVPYDDGELARHHDLLTRTIGEVTGYDRVMIYRFHDDWSGEVIAETTTGKLGSYLSLRFPASDIPAIARELYMVNPSRMIPDSASKPVPVLGVEPAPPDLTWSNLRSVSPVHLEYLGHMGAGASFSIPIRVAGRLWGLVACHHLGARLLPPDCRTVCESLINAYSLGLTSHLASRRFQMLDSLERRIGKILEALAEHDDPLDGIARMADLLKDTMDAQAFAMAAGDDVVIAGDGPDLDAMGVIDDWFLNESSDTVAFTDHLADIFPDQPMLLAAVSGMAAVKARSANSGWVCFYWFRPAQPQEVAWAGNPDKPVVENTNLAVLFIDLDNFKVINDSLGHDVGDQLLKQATERLRSCVRDCDTLARLGGDEFVVVLMDVELKKINSLAGRIVDFIGGSFNIGGKSLFVSASIGISVFPGDGEDSVSLLKHADTAMYRAKERGRNQYQFFAEEMKVVALQRLTLETGLRLAIEMGTLRLCYQPQVDIRTGAVVGAEALLRWHDPNLGDVSPVQFIPIAESCGLIGAVGEVVFALALKQIAEWRRSGLTVPRIAINVSAHQLRAPGFVDKVAGWLTENGLNADAIGIELTESALMERIDMVKDMLVRFDHMGVKISIDDFGTGYSSLSYLKKLPIHELKIDRSFVDGIASDRDDRSITIAIIDMSRALGMRVVAEGVETEDQLGVLTEEGCDMIQGYLFHRPLSPEAFAEVLRTGGKKELAKAGGMAAFR